MLKHYYRLWVVQDTNLGRKCHFANREFETWEEADTEGKRLIREAHYPVTKYEVFPANREVSRFEQLFGFSGSGIVAILAFVAIFVLVGFVERL